MITTALIGIQTICVGITAYFTYKTTKKTASLKLVEKVKGFKHFKTGGF